MANSRQCGKKQEVDVDVDDGAQCMIMRCTSKGTCL